MDKSPPNNAARPAENAGQAVLGFGRFVGEVHGGAGGGWLMPKSE